MSATRAPIAIVHPYWTLWEHTAASTFRADRLALARHVAGGFSDVFDPVVVEQVASVEDGRHLGASVAERDPAAVLLLVSMAAPPTYALALLDALPSVPVVVWALHETGLVGGDFDHGGITAQGATVGGPMLTNMLARTRRPFELVLGRMDDPDAKGRVLEALRLATIASGLRRARLGRIGRPIEGYLHVDVDDELLREAMGFEIVLVDPDEVVEAWRSIGSDRVHALEAEVRADWELEEDLSEGESLVRSLRAALALEDVADRHRLDGGAFNCHVPQFRFGDEIGIAPCWGLGRLTTAGRPFTCTGDILTAVAMLTTKRLGAAALYHEIEAIDYASGEVVIANSGEHDLAWLAPGERPRLRRNSWFCGKDPRCGVCAVLEPSAGPATLVGFTPHPDARGGFRYVVARGELTTRRFPETGTPNGAFRFSAGPVEEAWTRWASTGVNHHSSATPGDVSMALAGVADLLGVEAIVL
jgi:L-arabinose isomerase